MLRKKTPAAAMESGIGFTVLASHWKMEEAERGRWSRVTIMALLRMVVTNEILGKLKSKLFLSGCRLEKLL